MDPRSAATVFCSSHMTRRSTALLALGLLLAGAAHAASDEDKLRLLSCANMAETVAETVAGTVADGAPATGAPSGAADWLNRTAEALPKDEGLRLAGPVVLGKACLRKLRIMGSFGAMVTQGEICNARLEEFTGALAAIGILLDSKVQTRLPGVVLGRAGPQGQYLISKGLVDMRNGEKVPTTAPYAFTCTAVSGGAQ